MVHNEYFGAKRLQPFIKKVYKNTKKEKRLIFINLRNPKRRVIIGQEKKMHHFIHYGAFLLHKMRQVMDTEKEKFDFICSMGGNCMAASQLAQRGLRTFSLPFDWLFYEDEKPVYKISEYLKNGFENFLLKENLKDVKGDPRFLAHEDNEQYQDLDNGIYFLNHFKRKITDTNEYEIVKEKMTKRVNRFLNCLNKSNKILFLFSHHFPFKKEGYIDFYKTLCNLYPDKNFYIKAVQFDCSEESETFENGRIEIIKFKRENNLYDYKRTNIEWRFLDNLVCDLSKLIEKEPKKKNYSLFKAKKVKKGVSLSILPFLNTLLYIKLYIFGLRLWLTLGKEKEI